MSPVEAHVWLRSGATSRLEPASDKSRQLLVAVQLLLGRTRQATAGAPEGQPLDVLVEPARARLSAEISTMR